MSSAGSTYWLRPRVSRADPVEQVGVHVGADAEGEDPGRPRRRSSPARRSRPRRVSPTVGRPSVRNTTRYGRAASRPGPCRAARGPRSRASSIAVPPMGLRPATKLPARVERFAALTGHEAVRTAAPPRWRSARSRTGPPRRGWPGRRQRLARLLQLAARHGARGVEHEADVLGLHGGLLGGDARGGSGAGSTPPRRRAGAGHEVDAQRVRRSGEKTTLKSVSGQASRASQPTTALPLAVPADLGVVARAVHGLQAAACRRGSRSPRRRRAARR